MMIFMGREWHKVGIQTPPGWHDALGVYAKSLGLDIRDLYIAAIDLAFEADANEIKRRARELRDMSVDDWDGFLARHGANPKAVRAAVTQAAQAKELAPQTRRRKVAG